MFLKHRTSGYNGYALQWSPFFEHKLAVATASNFGLVGNGRLHILNVPPSGAAGLPTPPPAPIVVERVFDTQDGLFDVCWSEINENQLVTASGDGSVKLWDTTLSDFPIQSWQEHQREVFSVNWNLVRKDTFITASWDNTIKLWSQNSPASLQTFKSHSHCVYSAMWSPHSPTLFASCSGDHTVKLWDTNSPMPVQTILAHGNEVLSLDWNKYQDHTVVTGSVDHTIKVWDLRRPDRELNCLRGHEYAVRRVKCSPHSGALVASTSYDMTMRIWDITTSDMIEIHDSHTEFVLGVDFNLYRDRQIATCAWDENIHVFEPRCLM
ncbi:peroxisomal targeting signal 2 receptor [Lunasporangiospora selenospora]|uniref:Peroxin-7 n=1 Tax=Lunasporangiospora selenospora TaxID=979761 RepID=A0A9P6G162_9FUNG|nr:peroxisomal targeting signal 2 receptor [Lunasporangiospora selenospora]